MPKIIGKRKGTPGDPKILLSYRGNITDDLLSCIVELVEHKLDQQKTPLKVKKKVFKVMIESLQNVYHHLDDFPYNEAFSVSFTLQKEDLYYAITTGNHVHVRKVNKIKSLIDKVNGMSREELNSFYRDRLREGSLSKQGGAGLGIVDIIRKSGAKIVYNFRPVNKEYSYFSLKVKVSA